MSTITTVAFSCVPNKSHSALQYPDPQHDIKGRKSSKSCSCHQAGFWKQAGVFGILAWEKGVVSTITTVAFSCVPDSSSSALQHPDPPHDNKGGSAHNHGADTWRTCTEAGQGARHPPA